MASAAAVTWQVTTRPLINIGIYGSSSSNFISMPLARASPARYFPATVDVPEAE